LWSYLARAHGRYDVIHAHSYHALPALGAAVTGCRPLVFTPHYHGTGHAALRRLLHRPYRRAGAAIFRRASHVICVSEAEAALVRQHFPADGRRVTVIPNGVDVATLRAATPYPEDRTVILSVGRLEQYKNLHLVFEALAHLDDTCVLRVIGDGPARPALEAHAARLGLQGRVAFLGCVDDEILRRWLRTARVYVTMSGREAFGITLLEAAAAGAYVVAVDIPAYRELASSISAAAVSLVPLNTSSADLARAIRDAAAGARWPLAAPRMMSWDRVAAQTMEIYCTVVRNHA
jgi:glycosyltransferase involved in cell wall biosynthesis